MTDYIRDSLLSSMDPVTLIDPTSSNHTIETIQPNTRPIQTTGFPAQTINFSVQNGSSAQSFIYDTKNSYVNFTIDFDFKGTATTASGAGITSEIRLISGLLSRGVNVSGTHFSSPIEDVAFSLNNTQLSSDTLNKNCSMYLLNNILSTADNYDEYCMLISKASFGGYNAIYLPEHASTGNENSKIEYNANRTTFINSYSENLLKNIPNATNGFDYTTSAGKILLAVDATIHADLSCSIPLDILINAFTSTQYITSYAMSKIDLTLKLARSQAWDFGSGVLSIKNVELVLSRYTLNSSLSNEIVEKAMMDHKVILPCSRSNFSSDIYALSDIGTGAAGGKIGGGSVSTRIPGVYKPHTLSFYSHARSFAAGLSCVEYVPIPNPILNLNSSTIGKYPVIFRDEINNSLRYNLYCETCNDRCPISRIAFNKLGLLQLNCPEVSPLNFNIAVESGFVLQLGYSTNSTVLPTTAANYINSVEMFTIANSLVAYCFNSATPSLTSTAPQMITRYVGITQIDYDEAIEEDELKNDVIYYISK